jgi:hypothetical protein
MIRYTLKCHKDHNFESWFKSANAFETLHNAGQLSCPECGEAQITKSLMAPQVSTARKTNTSEDTDERAEPATPATRATQQTKEQVVDAHEAAHTNASLSKMRDHIEKNSDYVGTDFTKQARAMNDGETPARSIYGEAKLEDAKALIDEGVAILPLPFMPKRKLN